jgi:hypothetical protein
MRVAFHWALWPACAVMLLTACEPNQLYLASHTVLGVNAAVNPEQTNGWLIVGYDRTFATVIPRSAPPPAGADPQTRDAMSVLACSSLSVQGITIKSYTESLATGKAATLFADKLKNGANDVAVEQQRATLAKVKDFFSCFRDKPAPAPDATK